MRNEVHSLESLHEVEAICKRATPFGNSDISPRRILQQCMAEQTDLALEEIYFPLGFPVRVSSNHQAVLEAAERSWSKFDRVFDCEPLDVRFVVHSDSNVPDENLPLPNFELKDSMLIQTAGEHNYVVADLCAGVAVGRVAEVTARCHSYFRYHFLESAALSMLATLRCMPLHAACVRVGDVGILLCGDSGAGKSTLAFAGSRAGWTYVTDDASYLPIGRTDRLVVGNCNQVRFRPSAAQLFPELVGCPITPRAAGKPSIELPTSTWPQLKCSLTAEIHAIVFVNRRAGSRQELVLMEAAMVREWFEKQLLKTEDSVRAQEAGVARLLTANVFELRYQDLAWGIERIEQLAENGI